MSKWQKDDLIKTKEEILNPSRLEKGKNWLRHTGQALRIDELLLNGATAKNIAQDIINKGLSSRDIHTTTARVKNHIKHLKSDEHNLPLKVDNNDLWIFDAVGIDKQIVSYSLDKSTCNLQKFNYLPTNEDIKTAYRMLTLKGEFIPIESVLDQIEKNTNIKLISLHENWRTITKIKINSGLLKGE